MEIIVTFDKLTIIIGVLESLALQEYLDDPARTVSVGGVTLKGSTIWRRLERAQNIDLNNPEISYLLNMLLSDEAKQKVANYVAAQSAVSTPPQPGGTFAWDYRIPKSLVPAGANPVYWAAEFCRADNSIWVEGEWIYIQTNGALKDAPAETEVA